MSQQTENVPAEPSRPAATPRPVGAQPPPASPSPPEDAPTGPAPASPARATATRSGLTRFPIRRPRPPRRTRVVVRTIAPWSVLKLSLVFYFCVWLIVFFALVIIYMLMSAVGAIDSVETLLGYLFSTGRQSTAGPTPIEINEGVVGLITFVGGCVLTVAWSVINVLVAFLYNLIADVVGGVEVTLAENRHGS